MERWVCKVVALIIIFVSSFVGCVLPIKVKDVFLKWGNTGIRLLSNMMCFGGGVFFAIYILHMGPEARVIIEEGILHPHNVDYPLSELLMAIGFFMMVVLEKSIEIISVNEHNKKHANQNGKEAKIEENDSMLTKTSVACTPQEEVVEVRTNGCISEHHSCDIKINGSVKEINDIELNGSVLHRSMENVGGHSHMPMQLSGARSLVLLLALSLHHVFEGMSVGLQHSNTDVWNMTIGIVSHEVVIAFSLGLQLVKAYPKSPKKVILAGFLCQVMTPIGIAIGMLLMETGRGNDTSVVIANGILQSISTGVFIYVTFFEILTAELNEGPPNMMKVLFMFMGFVAIALLMLIPEDGGNYEDCLDLNCTVT